MLGEPYPVLHIFFALTGKTHETGTEEYISETVHASCNLGPREKAGGSGSIPRCHSCPRITVIIGRSSPSTTIEFALAAGSFFLYSSGALSFLLDGSPCAAYIEASRSRVRRSV